MDFLNKQKKSLTDCVEMMSVAELSVMVRPTHTPLPKSISGLDALQRLLELYDQWTSYIAVNCGKWSPGTVCDCYAVTDVDGVKLICVAIDVYDNERSCRRKSPCEHGCAFSIFCNCQRKVKRSTETLT